MKKILKLISNSPLEFILIGLILFSLISYIFYLKFSTKNQSYFLEVVGKVEGDSSLVQNQIKSFEKGAKDKYQGAEVVDMKYFIADKKDWQPEDAYYDLRLQLKVKTEKTGQKIFYRGQEIFIGSSILLEMNSTTLQFKIANVQSNFIEDETSQTTVVVKIYSKPNEVLGLLHEGLEFKDSSGEVYAVIEKMTKKPADMTVNDQFGKTHLVTDPLNYNVILTFRTKVKKDLDGKLTGYNGRSLSIGKRFVFNYPQLELLDGYVIEVGAI